MRLVEEIEKEKKEREEKLQKGEDAPGTSNMTGIVDEHGQGSPMVLPCPAPASEVSRGGLDESKTGDVKMEEQ